MESRLKIVRIPLRPVNRPASNSFVSADNSANSMNSLRLILVAASIFTAVADAAAPAAPPIFDWSIRDAQVPGVDIAAVPHPGADWPAGHSIYRNLYASLDAQGLPLALMLHDNTGPATGSRDPNALTTVMSYAPHLNFVFSDFEDANRTTNVTAMVNQVRSNSNPLINLAYIGNYGDFPGAADFSRPYQDQVNRTANDTFYRTSGLNVAQPALYPYEFYETHVQSALWGSNISPNKRSALFWAPLEKYSLAKRELPSGHRIIPWIAGFIAWPGYDAPEPTFEDDAALVQHVRLRGADGYYRLVGWYSNTAGLLGGYRGITDPNIATQTHRSDMLAAWHQLDWVFDQTDVIVLNLGTNKVSGFEWSGVSFSTGSVFLLSNLGNTSAAVDLPALPGVPDFSPMIGPGSHVMLSFPALSGDYNFNGVVDAADYVAWRKNDGTQAGYDTWRTNFGHHTGSGSAVSAITVVPEPAAVALLIVAAVGIRLQRRRST